MMKHYFVSRRLPAPALQWPQWLLLLALLLPAFTYAQAPCAPAYAPTTGNGSNTTFAFVTQQSFTATCTGKLTTFTMKPGNFSDDLRASGYYFVPSIKDATGTTTLATLPRTDQYYPTTGTAVITFDFSAANVVLTAGTQYRWELAESHDAPNPRAELIVGTYDVGNPYAGGDYIKDGAVQTGQDVRGWTINIAATVQTGAVTGPLCAGSAVPVPFTAYGTIGSGNTYTAQLSDASGSFAAPVTIGTLSSPASSGSIAATVPAGTASGTGYRIRAVASTAGFATIPNPVNLTVNGTAAPTGAASQSFSAGATVANLAATGTAIRWYAASSGGTALASSTALTNGTTYYASQTVGGYESCTRLAVTATVASPVVVATVTTTAPTGVASTRATLGGTVTADGGAAVTERGVVYVAGTGTPTTANSKVAIGTGLGSYSQLVAGLAPGTQYTVRAYAINSAGTGYGSNQSFTTAAALAASISGQTNVSCNGGSNGSATVSVSGGVAPYTYSWSPSGGTAATATGLSAGTYTVTVTDATSATTTATATITQPAAAVGGTAVITNVTCNGGSNGTINLTPSGGTGPYTFNWGSGITTEDRTNLAAGTYTVTITDVNSCTGTVSATVVQPTSLASSISAQTNVSCFGGSNGSATVSVSGGTAGYAYSWSPSGGTAATAAGLAAGTYTLTITDANGCTKTQGVTITQPASALSVSTSKTDATTNGGTDGTATATATGGTPGYTYSWNTSPVQTTATATGLPAGTYTVAVTDSKGCTATGTATVGQPAAAPQNLTISTGTAASPTAIAAGTYNTITVTGTGYGQLAGAVVVTTGITVQGGLNTSCQALTGAGSFTLAAGATLGICDDNGITSTGTMSGAVQVNGTRSFSLDASYVYNGNAGVQSTGTGLPAQVRNLTAANDNNDVRLSQPLRIAQVLAMTGKGNLLLNGQALTLLSDANGTALVVNTSTGLVTGTTATVQRYLDPSLNPGLGYRHLAAPVSGSTVNDLATASFVPVVNGAYNSSATPGTVSPFPTVFGYDQARVGTAASNFGPFDQGWVSPTALTDALTVGQGYTVNLNGGLTPDFTGTLTSGPQTLALGRGAAAEAGWALVGNPYPAPLDWNLVAPADRAGLDAAIYVFESSSQYAGSYRASVNGVGGNANSGSALVGTGQGFFVRVSSGQPTGSLTFRNSQRLSSYASQVPVRRGAADTRPLVQLRLQGGNAPADELLVYVQAGATAGFDAEFDAAKLPNSTRLNLAALATTGQALAIQGLPLLTAATVVPLTVDVPATGSYAFTAPALNNLPATTRVELVDNLTGTRQDLRMLPAAGYAFGASATHLAGRFSLNLTPAGALASSPAALAAQVLAYPSPAHDRLALVRPAGAATTAELVNTLGQVVRRFALPTPETTLDVRELAAGVYVLRLALDGQPVSKRLIIE